MNICKMKLTMQNVQDGFIIMMIKYGRLVCTSDQRQKQKTTINFIICFEANTYESSRNNF